MHISILSLRNRVILCLLALITAVLFWQPTEASSKSAPIKVYLDLEEIQFDVQPTNKNGTTLVPFRQLFEALGMEIGWNKEKQLITATKDGLAITLNIGAKTAQVNNKTISLLQPAEITNGRTLVPLRFVAESTGAYVNWNSHRRDIVIVTEAFQEKHGLAREELKSWLDDYFGTGEKPAASEVVDLTKLRGMYYGYRTDYGGEECGGICWDLYTFLPKQQVVLGPPAAGGPENINCQMDECLDYTIANQSLRLSNGEKLPINISEDGYLTINEVTLEPVRPLAAGTMFHDDYKYVGYKGTLGPHVKSWTYNLSFRQDGTYESSGFTLSSFGMGTSQVTPANAAEGGESKGTYQIKQNTLTLTTSDGEVNKLLIFIHNDSPPGIAKDIQIGEIYYSLIED